MKKFDYTITGKEGLHSRPAGLLAKEAAKFCCDIQIKNKETGKTGDAKKLYSLAQLSLRYDTPLEISISGVDEQAACEELEKFFEENI